MMRIAAAAILAASLETMSASAALAQLGEIRPYLYDQAVSIRLDYAWSECPWECQVAMFECEKGSGRAAVTIVGVSHDELSEWLMATPDFEPFALSLRTDTQRHELTFDDLTLSDRDTSWWIKFLISPAVLSAVATAETISVATPVFELDLPDDGEARAAFVEACLAR